MFGIPESVASDSRVQFRSRAFDGLPDIVWFGKHFHLHLL